MEQDEAGAHARLKALRATLIDPKIAEHGGRVVKTAGDGMLLEFGSATAALRCAIDVQRAMAARNRDLAPEARIEFRIGINVGDIIVDGDDVAGDGVNIASRLETMAVPGGICIAAAVRDQVREDLDAAFVDLGEQQVKNIARPIHVFRVTLEHGAEGAYVSARVATGARRPRWLWPAAGALLIGGVGVAAWLLWQSTAPPPAAAAPAASIAIMPFTVSGGTEADAVFADLLTRDVTAALARGRTEFVVTSYGIAATYKGKPIDARAVGRDLNVRYVAEGNVRRAGDQLNVSMQLVDTTKGAQVWSGRLDFQPGRPGDDEAAFTHRLTGKLRAALFDASYTQMANAPGPGRSAQDLVARAIMMSSNTDLKSHREAGKLLDEVLQREPNFLPALITRFWVLFNESELDSRADYERMAQRMDELSDRAVGFYDNDANAWLARSLTLGFRGRLDAALEANAVARRLDPTNKNIRNWRGWFLILKGQPNDALQALAEAYAAFPDENPLNLRLACLAHMQLGQYAAAIASCEKSSGQQTWYFDHALLAAAYANTGDTAKAASAMAELLRLLPGYSMEVIKARRYSEHPAFLEQREAHLLSGLRKAGLPEK